ncbi:hypothetical protein [Marinobacter sp.]|uniref:hypothetical protein n=1 Tax=Marinobacter sp. TaxID=50741 RepID=UPI003A8F7069
MPAPIVLANLTPAIVMGNESPKISSHPDLRDGTRGDTSGGGGNPDPDPNPGPGSGTTGQISWNGVVAHGGELTITDGESRFGTRQNVKPLYVNTGGGKTDTALGRDTGNKFAAAAVYQTTQKVGSIPGAVGTDHYNNSTDAAFDGLVIDPDKPVVCYVERYYGYDVTDSAYQNGSGGFNHKAFRIWAQGDNNNLYYTNREDGSASYFVEYVWTGGSDWFSPVGVWFQWHAAEILFKNSDLDQSNGIFEYWADGVTLKNADPNDNRTPMTRKAGKPNPLVKLNLDQVSNNTGQSSITYVGYTCIDDEYNGVYVGNASTRGACTKLVRQPQTAWAPGQIKIQLIESLVPVGGSYLYFRTGKDTWVSDSGVILS